MARYTGRLEGLHGHGNIRANICYDCEGELKDDKGNFHERLEDRGSFAFAAAICRRCKDKEIAKRNPQPAARIQRKGTR